jgi:hypothetical protein
VNGEYLAALDDARRSAADGAQQLPQNLLMQMRPQATTPHIEMRTQETVRARAACSRVDECCRARQFRERIAAQLVQQQRSTIQPQQHQQQQQQVQMSALMSAPMWNQTSSWSSSTTAQPSSMSLSELTQLQQTLSQQGATQSLNLPLGEVHGVLPAMTPAMSSAGSRVCDSTTSACRSAALSSVLSTTTTMTATSPTRKSSSRWRAFVRRWLIRRRWRACCLRCNRDDLQ